ncbi:hypothetical protein [Mesorhizobium sp. L-8-10]|uniref:hypothetical protein n=1 Tax=Mesorhizobium sp. L-8-10 TaxID=2744523 RepID=UPI00192815EF|nr:hypothetical protein [Mesorhizobium sp. L-8-10]
MAKFTFDAKLSSAFSVAAPDRSTAEKWLYGALDGASIEIPGVQSGAPIVGAVCLDGEIVNAGDVEGCPGRCDQFR